MRVLALDTTTLDGSVAVADDDRLVIERRGDRARPLAERLPTDLVSALAEAQLSTSDVDLFAVIAGPGSFTGLRIGIAAMQGLALVHGKRLVALSALEVIATAASLDEAPGTVIAAWMDAHRHEVFAGLYRVNAGAPFEPGRLSELEPPTSGPPEAMLVRWQALGWSPAIVVGDGATLYAELAGRSGRVLPHPLLATTAARMATARANRGQTVDPAGVQPVYVRRPDVEVAREAKRAAEAATANPPSTP